MKSMLSKDQIEDMLEYIDVQKVGQWKGDKISFCCPIHGENNPSCGINADLNVDGEHIQVFNCFSCGASGTLVWFLYKSLPDEFKSVYDAERFIQERYGIDYGRVLSELKRREIKRITSSKRKDTTDTKKVLSRSFIAPFRSGKSTYKYFFQRGFTPAGVEYWARCRA